MVTFNRSLYNVLFTSCASIHPQDWHALLHVNQYIQLNFMFRTIFFYLICEIFLYLKCLLFVTKCIYTSITSYHTLSVPLYLCKNSTTRNCDKMATAFLVICIHFVAYIFQTFSWYFFTHLSSTTSSRNTMQ